MAAARRRRVPDGPRVIAPWQPPAAELVPEGWAVPLGWDKPPAVVVPAAPAVGDPRERLGELLAELRGSAGAVGRLAPMLSGPLGFRAERLAEDVAGAVKSRFPDV